MTFNDSMPVSNVLRFVSKLILRRILAGAAFRSADFNGMFSTLTTSSIISMLFRHRCLAKFFVDGFWLQNMHVCSFFGLICIIPAAAPGKYENICYIMCHSRKRRIYRAW